MMSHEEIPCLAATTRRRREKNVDWFAAWIPARRVSAVDPVTVLRAD